MKYFPFYFDAKRNVWMNLSTRGYAKLESAHALIRRVQKALNKTEDQKKLDRPVYIYAANKHEAREKLREFK